MPDYLRLRRLGEGNFGEVWLVYDRALGVYRAVKYVPPSRIQNPTEFYREPQTLVRLRNDYIVRVEDAGQEYDGTLYIAMEYLPQGSIKDKFRGRPLPILKAREFLYHICWGLEFAHQRNYIHRDIKPSNVLIGRDGNAKISDFGLVARTPRDRAASPYGYITHLAPEVFIRGFTSKLTDIYALGVTAYRLFNGDAFLPSIDTDVDIEDLIINGKYPDRRHYRPCIPSSIRRIVNKAMHIDPTKRYQSASTFRRALEAISLRCSWEWRPRGRSVIYTASISHFKIKTVVKERQDGKFDIITTKKSSTTTERHVRKDCVEGLSLSKMKPTIHKILSRYVTEGK